MSLITLALVLLLTGAGAMSLDVLLGWAMPLDQLPLWVVLLLVLIPFGGVVAMAG